MDEVEVQVEHVKEKTKLYTELIKILTALFIAVGAGVITILKDGIENNTVKIILVSTGIVLTFVLLIAIVVLFFVAFDIVKKLER